jgi:hypothetical protein
MTILHHFGVYSVPKGEVCCASDGTVYAALDQGGVLILSKDGTAKEIPVPGYVTSVGETTRGEIWFGAYYIPQDDGGILRVNADGTLERFADVGYVPRFALAQPDGSAIFLTEDKLQQVQPDGSVTMLHEFTVPFQGLGPTALFRGNDGAFIGTTRTGGLENGGVIFRLVPVTNEYSVLKHLHGDNRDGTYAIEWRKEVFPLRIASEAGNLPPMARDDFVDAGAIEAAARKTGVPELELRVLANDADADGDPLTITAVTAPAFGTATIARGGQTIVYQAASASVANDSFLYTISDSYGGTATARVAIRRNPDGRYSGDIISDANATTGDPGTLSGTLALHVSSRRLVAGRVVLLGRAFTFSGRFNEGNQLGKVLFFNPRTAGGVSVQLTLRSLPDGYTVDARIMKDWKWFSAPCTLAPPSN